jgi:tocopherol O-methyltransferase
MIEELLTFGGIGSTGPLLTPKSILDVGCGIGGSSRYLAKRFPGASVKGISLSPSQVARATSLAKQANLDDRVSFQVGDALKMPFEDNSFDFVWTCESGTRSCFSFFSLFVFHFSFVLLLCIYLLTET